MFVNSHLKINEKKSPEFKPDIFFDPSIPFLKMFAQEIILNVRRYVNYDIISSLGYDKEKKKHIQVENT